MHDAALVGFLSGYSLAAILGGCALGIVATAVALAPLLRRTSPAAPPGIEALPQPQWAEPGRPLRCPRCGAGELVHVPGLELSAAAAAAPPRAGPLGQAPVRHRLEVELLVCGRCGRAEWFAGSPRGLEPFRGRPAPGSRAPYRG